MQPRPCTLTVSPWRPSARCPDAQQRGDLATEIKPDDLLITVLAMAQAWFWAAEDVDPGPVSQPWSPERLAPHRSAVVEAARRIGQRTTEGS
ncbi:hypothetical protein ACFVZR_37405 [Streptomyces sp. NPDC058316]|uniref:hypothetical protein n=1 Tax=unclassified Streptomyces TaxID=2593676 RepID=UPI0036EA625D